MKVSQGKIKDSDKYTKRYLIITRERYCYKAIGDSDNFHEAEALAFACGAIVIDTQKTTPPFSNRG